MNKHFITAWLLTAACLLTQGVQLCAQEKIRGIIVDNHDAAWYSRQQTLWRKRALLEPHNEHSWRQAFEAARYADMQRHQYGMTQRKLSLLTQMKHYIPDTYTYNLCMYKTNMGPNNVYADAALRKLPAEVDRLDAETLLGYLWMSGRLFADGSEAESTRSDTASQRLSAWLLQRQYTSNAYPSYLLRYAYNSLQGMERNALYFVNGDVPGLCSLVLQGALHVHEDKVIIPLSFLHVEVFRDALCRLLGIEPFVVTKNYRQMDNWEQEFLCDVVEHLISRSSREAYFFPGAVREVKRLEKKLYNEGLVFRYSNRSYNNMAVAKRNVETRYHLEYLMEPSFVSEDQWKGSERIQLNYMVMLAPVVKAYRQEGNDKRAQWLSRHLWNSVQQTSISQDEKQKYFDLLEEKRK